MKTKHLINSSVRSGVNLNLTRPSSHLVVAGTALTTNYEGVSTSYIRVYGECKKVIVLKKLYRLLIVKDGDCINLPGRGSGDNLPVSTIV